LGCSSCSGCKFVCLLQSLFHGLDVLCRWFFLSLLWGNGITERFNRTLLNMLGTLDSSQKKDWKYHVAGLVHAYNCTRQTTTGYGIPCEMVGYDKDALISAFGSLKW
jgi:hypothetical protein